MNEPIPFEQQFSPVQFYRRVREKGFTREDAKAMTRHYAKNTYQVILRIYDLRYQRNGTRPEPTEQYE